MTWLALQHMRHSVHCRDDLHGAWHFRCKVLVRRHLVTWTARVSLAVVLPLVFVCALFTPQQVTVSQSAPLPATATTPVSDHIDFPDKPADLDRDGEGGVRDVYGNDVAPAVAKYSFDATGSLYEVHSPQTELPRLASPKS